MSNHDDGEAYEVYASDILSHRNVDHLADNIIAKIENSSNNNDNKVKVTATDNRHTLSSRHTITSNGQRPSNIGLRPSSFVKTSRLTTLSTIYEDSLVEIPDDFIK